MENENSTKNIILSVIGVIVLVIGVIGISYAFFTYTGEGSTANVVTAGSITFSYSDATAKGNGINLVNEMPRTDAEGMALIGDNNTFNFIILADTTAASVNYEIVAKKQPASTLADNKVKIYLTDITTAEIATGKTMINTKVTKYSELTDTTLKDKTGKSLYEESITKGNSTYRKEFRVRMWIAEDVNMALPENHNKVFKVRINVYANVGVKEAPKKLLADELVKNLGTNGTVYEPTPGSTKYIRSATTTTDPSLVNNYVWWSGMMWRIFAINPDGSMKIITDDNVSALPFHNTSNVYATSHMKEWLETYFYPKLNSSKDTVLKQNNDFCIGSTDDGNSARITCTNKLPNLKVGLLTLDEYNNVKNGSNTNYLNNGTNYWLMTPHTTDASGEWCASSGGGGYSRGVGSAYGGRVVTVFASALIISSGNGTLGTPYKITDDTAPAVSGTKLNLRYTGEFITYDNKLWRIMEVENGLTKVIYDGAAKLTIDGIFGSNNLDWATIKAKLDSIGISTTKIVQNQVWQRGYMIEGNNVLTTSLGAGNPVTSTFGLPKVGEMWASQNNNKTANYAKFTAQNYWLMTPHTSKASYEWYASSGGYSNSGDVSSTYGERLVFFFASASTISSGNGTPDSPYVLQ